MYKARDMYKARLSILAKKKKVHETRFWIST